jgi:hypothetical protein
MLDEESSEEEDQAYLEHRQTDWHESALTTEPRGSDGAKIDVEVDDEDVWLGRVDVFALGVDGKDVRSGVVEKKLDVSLAKDEGEGTRQPSSGEKRPKRSFTHSMDRRMSHTLPGFQLDDVLKRLKMGNFDRISSDTGRRNCQTIYRTLTAKPSSAGCLEWKRIRPLSESAIYIDSS